MKYIIKITFFLPFLLGSFWLHGQAAIALSTPTSCLDVCDGSLTVTIDPNELDPGTVPPFQIEYENEDNGDAESSTMNGYEITFS